MEKLVGDKVRAIGVRNLGIKSLEKLLEHDPQLLSTSHTLSAYFLYNHSTVSSRSSWCSLIQEHQSGKQNIMLDNIIILFLSLSGNYYNHFFHRMKSQASTTKHPLKFCCHGLFKEALLPFPSLLQTPASLKTFKILCLSMRIWTPSAISKQNLGVYISLNK